MTPSVLIITTMRNEGPHLVEWVAHCRAAGADDILVFSNDCTDGTDDLLDALDRAGALTHIRNVIPEGRTPQWAALKQAADHPLTQSADWIAVLDCDEFINLRPPLTTFGDLIHAVDADAIVLPWRLFGNAGHLTRPNGMTLDAYTQAIPADALYPALARFFKTLYRRETMQKPGVHRPRQKKATAPRWVDGSGNRLDNRFAKNDGRIMLWGAPLATDLVQLNHYSVRSVQDFLLKSARGLPNHTDKAVDLTYWVERNFNTVADTSIAVMAPATRAEYARLMTDPTVAAAQSQSNARTAAALEHALRDPDTVNLMGRLILANSIPPREPLARALVAHYQQALKP
ncbi:glycosyltransferase family 2 protein [Oceaniglobus ichthyenteri]|uniref:glycosyltransferase family 2 protein n=1 Tax=Oceaniglobus ichthyenteri TaxID=2136177 RepID=UPI000D3B34A5|nr:glycosyltransferase family 2 protein [Oceaniglobus ichthyenteri]